MLVCQSKLNALTVTIRNPLALIRISVHTKIMHQLQGENRKGSACVLDEHLASKPTKKIRSPDKKTHQQQSGSRSVWWNPFRSHRKSLPRCVWVCALCERTVRITTPFYRNISFHAQCYLSIYSRSVCPPHTRHASLWVRPPHTHTRTRTYKCTFSSTSMWKHVYIHIITVLCCAFVLCGVGVCVSSTLWLNSRTPGASAECLEWRGRRSCVAYVCVCVCLCLCVCVGAVCFGMLNIVSDGRMAFVCIEHNIIQNIHPASCTGHICTHIPIYNNTPNGDEGRQGF